MGKSDGGKRQAPKPQAKGQEMKTVKIKHDSGKDGYAIINEADFDAKLHTLFDAEPKRARKSNGHLKADDPSTPDVNEAWEGGKAPTKKKTTRKPAAKKKAAK